MKDKLTIKCRSAAVLALALLATSVWGGERRVVPPEPWSVYATGLGNTGDSSDDWVVTAFYYPPQDIPGDYDLSVFPVDAPPVGVDTPLVQGFIVVDKNSPPPAQIVFRNAPGVLVPIWFTPVPKFVDGVDGIPGVTWTVNSMLAEDSMVGYAASYSEVDEPTTTGSHATIQASGFLAHGRSFRVETTITVATWNGHAKNAFCRVYFGP